MRQAAAGAIGEPGLGATTAAKAVGRGDGAASSCSEHVRIAWLRDSLDGFVGESGSCSAVGAGPIEQLDLLATELGCPPSTPDGELVARAYARWGAEVPARLQGRFWLAAWDSTAETALLAVDRLGSMSIFVAERGSSLLFATEVAPLLRLLDSQPGPDRSAVAEWLVTGTTPLGRTLYEGVSRLTGGEAITYADGRLERRRYWHPRYQQPISGSRAELAHVVRRGVSGAVTRRMPGAGKTAAIFVSGGLDSGAVAAIAVETAAGALRGYSATFPDHPAIDESPLVLELSDSLRLPVELVPVRVTGMLPAALEYLASWRVPSPSPNLHFTRRLVEKATVGGAHVVLDGEGGDELFGLAPFYLASLARRGRVDRMLALARRFPGAPSNRELGRLVWRYGIKGAAPAASRTFVHRLTRRRLPYSTWLREEAVRARASIDEQWAWKSLPDGPLWWRSRIDELISRRQRMGAYDHLRRTRGAGLLDAHPFLDDLELIELVLRLPPAASFDPELDRPLLRAAVEGALPDSIRLRREKSYFDSLFRECLEGPDRRAIETLLGARDARVLEYVRPEFLRSSIVGAPPGRRHGLWAWATWRLLAVETWLRSLEEEAFPARAAEELAVPEG